MIKSQIILASKSPRRKDLLTQLGVDFKQVSLDVEEVYPSDLDLSMVPEFLAKKKAMAYGEVPFGSILLTADTIVLQDNQILEKPKDEDDARRMLQLLNNASHTVITGVFLKSSKKERIFSVQTEVFFKKLTSAEIDFYIQNYHPYDKAGAYGIQEWIGLVAIDRISGSYTNIVGLPMEAVYQHLKDLESE